MLSHLVLVVGVDSMWRYAKRDAIVGPKAGRSTQELPLPCGLPPRGGLVARKEAIQRTIPG